jgi:predicted P-loop ATPase
MAGKWVAELAELDAMARRELSAVKRFFRQESDDYAAKYEAFSTDRPRRLIFGGTANDDTPLREADRCFLPVWVKQPVNLEWLRQNVDQLIAEAAHLEAQGETFGIPPELWGDAAERQEGARAWSPAEELLAKWLGTPTPAGFAGTFITAAGLAETLAMARQSTHGKAYGPALERLGYAHKRPYIAGRQTRAWVRPASDNVSGYVELLPWQSIAGGPIEMRPRMVEVASVSEKEIEQMNKDFS